MTDAFIYDHVRTPRGRGKKDGCAARGDGAAACRRRRCARSATATASTRRLVDDVIFGCVDPVGEAGGDIARAAALVADYGDHVPGMQINRFCASGLDAVNFAAAQVMAGAARHGDRRRRRDR